MKYHTYESKLIPKVIVTCYFIAVAENHVRLLIVLVLTTVVNYTLPIFPVLPSTHILNFFVLLYRIYAN